ncbi:MAG: thioredoxin family protein [Candidatus Cloacimonas sp.]|jgi:thioredoxin 1|nr:thioredoxin family protein [Candidatus Cloacimonas sp.]
MHILKYVLIIALLMMLFGCKGKAEQAEMSDQTEVAIPDSSSTAVATQDEASPAKSSDEKVAASQNQKQPASEAKPTTVQTETKKAELKGYKVTFMEIGSKSCIPCKMMQPIMKEIADEYKGIVKVEFYDLGVDRQIGPKYNIRVMPTQVFLDANGKEFFRHEGFYPKEELAKMLDTHLSKLPK